ncbi:molybdopterin-dependent oxidoreductase [Palleronia sp. LCG004]|uniref:molybdopterin-dependent oxidoreductase n=1 Tax=Palleronia sp. LCG004 TaxID=3079304 RepID=UPI002942AF0B|nr:molybdopterin-dependent oxidoreductase [Palleronia sp. LCG004]WOI57442.1 oxidoreductase [Palleronia sp. LCG004]
MFTRTFIAATVLSVGAAIAADLPRPEGDVILTVSGDIASTNADGMAEFDLAMLEEIGISAFETSTIWTDGTQSFEGVALVDLMETLGVEDGTLRATAINDYSIEIPVADAVEGGPILAYRRNGRDMSIRDKGPLWVVYPYDDNSEYRTEVIYSRSIWQLDRIEVKN